MPGRRNSGFFRPAKRQEKGNGLWGFSGRQCQDDDEPIVPVIAGFIFTAPWYRGQINRMGKHTMRKLLTLSTMAAIMAPTLLLPATPAAAKRYEYSEWKGRDGRTYCRKSDGTVGLIAGAAGGALVGRAIDTRGERATGTILGAAAGALIGREVARKRSCR